jgi:TRAP-type C4-dicarboxylate transport system permease small subunit
VNDAPTRRAGPIAVARRIIELWALAGGLLLVAIILMNAYSLVGDIVFGKPLAGDFELVEVGVAVAAFAFLPYCQLTGANVSADLFMQNVRPGVQAALSAAAGAIALAFAALLLWRMALGLVELRQYRETTTIFGFPIWLAYIPILASLCLLVVAALISLRDALAGAPSAGSSGH